MNSDLSSRTFLPDFCGTRMVFVVVMLAELLAIILTLAVPGSAAGRVADLALYSLLAQWIALTSVGGLCLLGARFRELPDHWAAALSYGTTLVISLAAGEVAWRAAGEWMGGGTSDHGGFLLRSMGISAIAWALALRYFYVRHQWRRRVESEANARFQALQSRIRPHFLFNCMNTIAGLARRQPGLAEQVVEDLADLFRASLRDADQPVSLAEELSLCERYLRIEQHRLGDRLRLDWDRRLAVPDIRVPGLTLQPLFENAVYHGIEPTPGGGTIRVTFDRRGNELVIGIANPLPSRDDGAPRNGNRLAQNNVAERLAAWFDRDDLLSIERTAGEYRVFVVIPLEKND
jgi:two-component system sensor histidine kinase AlgZ